MANPIGKTVKIKYDGNNAGKLGQIVNFNNRLEYPYKIRILETGQEYNYKRPAFEFYELPNITKILKAE